MGKNTFAKAYSSNKVNREVRQYIPPLNKRKTWKKAGSFLQKEVAPVAIELIGAAIEGALDDVGGPAGKAAGALLDPLIRASAEAAKEGNAKSFKRLTPQKYFQKVAWASLNTPIPGSGTVTRALGESMIHGNRKFLSRRLGGDTANSATMETAGSSAADFALDAFET